MIRVSAAEFQRNIGRYQDLALTEPVAVTRNGRERTVMISVEEYRRLTHRGVSGLEEEAAAVFDAESRRDDPTGEDLIRALQASPYRNIEIEPDRARLPVRDIEL
jgi:prevent-host-death family protein